MPGDRENNLFKVLIVILKVMVKIGDLNIKYSHFNNGIYYYSVHIDVNGVKRQIVLPRYHQMVGWIEVFGLPPQFEWVILETIGDFDKEAVLTIDGEEFRESVSYRANESEKQHEFTVTREGVFSEQVHCVESYRQAPQLVSLKTNFEHQEGAYVCDYKKSLIDIEDVLDTEQNFVDMILIENKIPDHVWRKHFTAFGKIPPVYYHFFPLISGLDVSQCSGSVLELGYQAGEEGVDAVHGDWHKLLRINDQSFYIKETGYSSREVTTPNGTERIKDTYRKELFKL